MWGADLVRLVRLVRTFLQGTTPDLPENRVLTKLARYASAGPVNVTTTCQGNPALDVGLFLKLNLRQPTERNMTHVFKAATNRW